MVAQRRRMSWQPRLQPDSLSFHLQHCNFYHTKYHQFAKVSANLKSVKGQKMMAAIIDQPGEVAGRRLLVVSTPMQPPLAGGGARRRSLQPVGASDPAAGKEGGVVVVGCTRGLSG